MLDPKLIHLIAVEESLVNINVLLSQGAITTIDDVINIYFKKSDK